MLSKNEIKFIRSLGQVKYRHRHGKFIVEGDKAISEILDTDLKCTRIYSLDPSGFEGRTEVTEVSRKELEQISFLVSPNDSLALFDIPFRGKPDAAIFRKKFGIICDGIRDPGNLGTIVRIADWFGLCAIICSNDCADVYSPKVVQSTMASIARVPVYYCDLAEWITGECRDIPVVAASLDGENIYGAALPDSGLLILGNESAGISKDIEKLAGQRIRIPGAGVCESLNVAVSAGILCAELTRQGFSPQK